MLEKGYSHQQAADRGDIAKGLRTMGTGIKDGLLASEATARPAASLAGMSAVNTGSIWLSWACSKV